MRSMICGAVSCSRLLRGLAMWVGLLPVSLHAESLSHPVSFERLKTLTDPGLTAEIVQYCPSQSLLLVTNPVEGKLEVLRVESINPLSASRVDFDEAKAGKQGLDLGGDPTSVAVHPRLPLALVVLLGRGKGTLVGVDLRAASLGRPLLRQSFGAHLDSVAISADGKWALIPDEAENDSNTPGAIWALDMSSITPDRNLNDTPPSPVSLPGLENLLKTPIGDIEPELVAFDQQSRFAAVSCQENDAVVLVDLSHGQPAIVHAIHLEKGAQPDGVGVLDGVPGPKGQTGCLIGVAEEGEKGRTGNAISLWWVDPQHPSGDAVLMSRLDVRPLVDPSKPKRRLDPESVVFARMHGRILSFIGIERANCVVCLDVTDPVRPRQVGKVMVGKRPEGLIVHSVPQGLLVVTGNEGIDGTGGVSFMLVRERTP